MTKELLHNDGSALLDYRNHLAKIDEYRASRTTADDYRYETIKEPILIGILVAALIFLAVGTWNLSISIAGILLILALGACAARSIYLRPKWRQAVTRRNTALIELGGTLEEAVRLIPTHASRCVEELAPGWRFFNMTTVGGVEWIQAVRKGDDSLQPDIILEIDIAGNLYLRVNHISADKLEMADQLKPL